jgi:hypothetical protein
METLLVVTIIVILLILFIIYIIIYIFYLFIYLTVDIDFLSVKKTIIILSSVFLILY